MLVMKNSMERPAAWPPALVNSAGTLPEMGCMGLVGTVRRESCSYNKYSLKDVMLYVLHYCLVPLFQVNLVSTVVYAMR